MKVKPIYSLILFCLCFTPAAHAQHISVAVGGLIPKSPSGSGTVASIFQSADFRKSPIVTVDAGAGFLPLVDANVHYSYSQPDVSIRKSGIAGSPGSTAEVGLGGHTVTIEAQVHPPRPLRFGLYGFAGAGVTRFQVDLKSQSGSPFPSGLPDVITSPVFTFGVGVEKKLLPLIAAKVELRDYTGSVPKKLYDPGGAWNRVAIVAGIVLGR